MPYAYILRTAKIEEAKNLEGDSLVRELSEVSSRRKDHDRQEGSTPSDAKKLRFQTEERRRQVGSFSCLTLALTQKVKHPSRKSSSLGDK